MTVPALQTGTDERFPASARVRRRRDFVRAQRKGRRVALAHFVALVARSVVAPAPDPARLPGAGQPGVDEPPAARLGIVASRRVGPAVVRNRIKRRLREWFRRRRDSFPRGIDLLLIVRPGADGLGWSELVLELDGAIGEIVRRSQLSRGGSRGRGRKRTGPRPGG